MKASRWTDRELRELRDLYPDHSNREIGEMLGRSMKSVNTMAKRLNLRKREGWDRHPSKLWPPDKVIRLRKLYLLHTKKEISAIMEMSISQISNALHRFGIKKPPGHINAGCFTKGHIPSNKGKKQTDFMSAEAIERTKATRFKKGHRPKNWQPVGSERIDSKDGYILVKVRNGLNGYRLKHHVVWEEHNGPVPEGFVVTFIDGNRTNCDISNLELKSKYQHLMKNCHDVPGEIRSLWQLKGALQRQINKSDIDG